MTNLSCPVSIVIPVFNEANNIRALLGALVEQTLMPAEIVLVDTGSTDATVERANSFWIESPQDGCSFKVISLPSGYPGLGRNVGIRQAKYEWIVFIDAGIQASHDWLENLWQCVQISGAKAAYGLCEFSASTPVASAVCALTYGFGARAPVIPSSIFHETLFEEVGYFREDLRSTEDIEWNQRFLAKTTFSSIPVCSKARTIYQGFPDTLWGIFIKWRLYETHAWHSGVSRKQHTIYLFLSILVSVAILLQPSLLGLLFLIYIFVRIMLDSTRRSQLRLWWLRQPLSLLMLLPAAFCIDAGKLSGIITGLMGTIRGKNNPVV